MDQKSHSLENYHVTHLLTIVSRFVTFFMLLFCRQASKKDSFSSRPPLSRAFGDEVLQVAGGGGGRGFRDGDVVVRTQPAFKAGESLFEHARQNFLLTFVQ